MRRFLPLWFYADDGLIATVEAGHARGRRRPVFRARCLECRCDLACLTSTATDQAVAAVIAHVAEFHGSSVREGRMKAVGRV